MRTEASTRSTTAGVTSHGRGLLSLMTEATPESRVTAPPSGCAVRRSNASDAKLHNADSQSSVVPMDRFKANIAALICLALHACAATGAAGDAEQKKPLDVAATRVWLRDFGAQYAYDVGYLEQLLNASPAAYETFAAAMGMADHRVHLPIDAHFVACISALMSDGCGACAQLNIKMAVEAGVDRQLLQQLLKDPERLPTALALVHRFACQVVKGHNADSATLDGLRAAYGDAGIGELAVNVLGARIYPALRRSMGAEFSCPDPTVDFEE